MGHKIGCHTHTHITVAASKLSEKDFQEEIIKPKSILEKITGKEIIALSYPYGEKKDCLSPRALRMFTEKYDYAFTVEEILNKNTNPLALGRYQTHSKDKDVLKILDNIIYESSNLHK